ncbi:MAG: integrase core domain-containing protein [Planctomycetaceae bacterium]
MLQLQEEFECLLTARRLSVSWKDEYNRHRPHSSLND